MKYNLIIILCLLTACFQPKWSTNDKKTFMDDCVSVGQTEQYCLCVLKCCELSFKTYNDALNNVHTSDHTSALNQCVGQCMTK